MSKRDDIMKIWLESFRDPKAYVTMFFNRIYRDDEAMLLSDPSGAPASTLLLQTYGMALQGSTLPVSYIMGAATRRSQRGKGYMSQLITRALGEAAARGHMLCSLIPSTSALYRFYARFGFSTVFFVKEQRFTAAHPFALQGSYQQALAPAADELWQAFDTFQHARPCYVLHTRTQFENILADLEADGGTFVAVSADSEDSWPEIASMAWAVKRDGVLTVTDVMGRDPEARTAALHCLRQLHPDVPVLLYGRPWDSTGGRLIPCGMARIVNASLLLGAIAQAHPELKMAIRVTDPILPDVNSHTYYIRDGVCTADDTRPAPRLDFDVTIDVLADMAFSAPHVGELLRFPSQRPMLSLMLD